MLSVWKRYEFGARTPISMSSYPGFLSSTDDYYQIGDLVIIETTLPNYNDELFRLIKPEAFPYWVRAMVANQLAISGPDWMEIFQKYNSGTYNCMWMVVDYGKFQPGEPLQKGLLTVGEQLPGYFHYEDQTQTLGYGYWPSYNAAVYPETARLIKQDQMQKVKGNSFSYEMVERAQIFRRDQGDILSDEGIQHILRYNKFQSDPIAHAEPCNQLACRSDLGKPGVRTAFGATDAKYTSSRLVQRGETVIQSGPTHDDQPVFDWRAVPELAAATPHVGHPDRFNFGWLVVGPDMSAHPWQSPDGWGAVGPLAWGLPAFVCMFMAAAGFVISAGLWRREPRSMDKPPDGYKYLEASPAASSISTACPETPTLP
mmetsp:Transcript_53706/g.154160  ORF Transcript_53706/g.154160 Transcript_53706/m.154160 type:complete len:371 (-) Transcript_53706:163-1275(-)